jgi:hypothetical protein
MTQEILSEFLAGWTMDNHLTAMSIRAGEPVDPGELIELCSGAKTVFSLGTLACRSLDRISACRQLWESILETFCRARTAWTDVPIDREPLLRFYLLQLERLNELGAARVDLYNISQNERLAFTRRHKDDIDSQKRTAKPNCDPSAEEKKIETFLSLPI